MYFFLLKWISLAFVVGSCSSASFEGSSSPALKKNSSSNSINSVPRITEVVENSKEDQEEIEDHEDQDDWDEGGEHIAPACAASGLRVSRRYQHFRPLVRGERSGDI